ncbi:MAG: amidohydrolase family protein, partial [Gemmatimonadaceae bacterium]
MRYTRRLFEAGSIALLACLTFTARAQTAGRFGDLAGGPYNRLVIRGAMVIPGHGGPPAGPYDILIEGNTITQMVPFDPVAAERRGDGQRLTGDRVIDATGMYVVPGMIDLHTHIRNEPMEMEYIYYLKLAHGVTTIVDAADRGYAHAMREARRSKANEILAPRMFPLVGWAAGTTAKPLERDDPAKVPEIMKVMADSGIRVISMDAIGWSAALVGAIAQEGKKYGIITSFHIPPSTIAVVNAVKAACLGVTMIEHHYAYAESALPRTTQDFGREYSFSNENHRFRYAGKVWLETDRERLLNAVADSLVKCGVTMLPTRVVYEANRDFLRASSLPWHEKYTHQALWNWNLPNPAYHGSFHYDWTSDDEYYWNYAFRLWGDLIFAFNQRGGRVAYGTDDNYIWATPGFSAVRELQLLRETGMHSLEVIKAATLNSAQTLREPKLGLVRPGYL